MKKYLFLCGSAAALGLLVAGAWGKAAALAAALFAWIAVETKLRTRFRFLGGSFGRESNFSLGGAVGQVSIAADGSHALFATLDGALSLRAASGRELWSLPLEPRTMAFLATGDGGCFYAVEDEMVRVEPTGRVSARLGISPPPFRQSYSLLLSADGSTLLLHTPWSLQFMDPKLEALRGVVGWEPCGHYMKYCALAPDGGSVYVAGAKLLDEESEGGGTQARWGCWKRGEGGAWAEAWAQREESQGNSHLRGLSLSLDGSALALELHRDGYEIRLLRPDGSLLWRRAGGERPLLSPDGARLLWESPFDGVILSEVQSREKLWTRKPEAQLRHKALSPSGGALLIEGRSLLKLGLDGAVKARAAFSHDPLRFEASADGLALAMVAESRGGLLRLALP